MAVSLIVAAAVLAAPMQVSGIGPHWPRLTQFPDASVMARVNADLAAKEKANAADYKECLSDLHDAGGKPDGDTWSVNVSVTYLSAHFLSVGVTSSNYCGGAYPNNGIETPVTFDLTTGRELDWKTAFKPGFLTDRLNALYRASYPKNADAECRSFVRDQPPFGIAEDAIFKIEAGKGLVVLPDLPHAVQACAEEVRLPAAKLAPYLKNATLLNELGAMK
jgi:hypothetical protein